MSKKVLFVIDSLGCGGAEKSLVSLLPLIDYNKYDVDLLMFARGGDFEELIPEQVNVITHDMFGNTLLDQMNRYVHQLFFSAQLRIHPDWHGAETRWRSMHDVIIPLEQAYDIAIAYQQGFPTFFVVTKVNASKKITWINADVYAAGYDMNYCRRFYDKVDCIVPVSNRLYDLLSEKSPWCKDKLYCIYDIINPDLIIKLSSAGIAEDDLFDASFNLVTVGRLSKPKNHLLAVDAARELKDRGLGFKWFFVGEGSMRGQIETRIKELGLEQNVFLLGMKQNPYPYMARADVYVQTSIFEGYGLTIAEAKILHRPVVSTNFEVVYDQIVDGENGLIVEMNPTSVADGVMRLHENNQLRKHIIETLSEEQNTTLRSEVEKFNHLLES